MSIDANTFKSLVNGYIGMSNRWVFSSVLRQRNARFEDPFNKQGSITGVQSLGPAFPFTILINPKDYNYTSWKNISTTNQGLDGPMEYFTSNVDLPTLHVSGSSGNLDLITNAFNDPKAIALFNQQLEPGFEDILVNNHGIDFTVANNEATNQLLEQFYRMMAAISNTKNIKIKTFLQLKSWCDEPNVVSMDVETFHNLKRIVLFSNLYPLGKTYWGIVDGGMSYNNDWETFRHVEWDFNFKVIKETRNDLDFDGIKPPAILVEKPIPTPKPTPDPSPKPVAPPQKSTVPDNPAPSPQPPVPAQPPVPPTQPPKKQPDPPSITTKKTTPPPPPPDPPITKKKFTSTLNCGDTKKLAYFLLSRPLPGTTKILDATDVVTGRDGSVNGLDLNSIVVTGRIDDNVGTQAYLGNPALAIQKLKNLIKVMESAAPCIEDIPIWLEIETKIRDQVLFTDYIFQRGTYAGIRPVPQNERFYIMRGFTGIVIVKADGPNAFRFQSSPQAASGTTAVPLVKKFDNDFNKYEFYNLEDEFFPGQLAIQAKPEDYANIIQTETFPFTHNIGSGFGKSVMETYMYPLFVLKHYTDSNGNTKTFQDKQIHKLGATFPIPTS